MDKKIKFVIIYPGELEPRYAKAYHLDELVNVLDVEWWDVSSISSVSFEHRADSLELPYVRHFKYKVAFYRALSKLPKDAVVHVEWSLQSPGNYSILKRIGKYFPEVVRFYFWLGSPIQNMQLQSTECNEDTKQVMEGKNVPHERKNKIYEAIKNLWHRSAHITWMLKRMKYGKKVGSLSRFVYETKMSTNPPFRHIYALSMSSDSLYRIHSMDYDTYLLMYKQENNPVVSKDYVVYIDQNFPLHPEFKRHYEFSEVEWQKKAAEFYQDLSTFFDKVEEQTGKEVIIAKHPCSIYETNTFGRHKILWNNTADLVRNSSGVIVQTSNAINFAIFWDKPILLAYDHVWEQCEYHYNVLKGVSNLLGIKTYCIDTPNTTIQDSFIRMPQSAREQYMSYFVDENTKDKTNLELFVTHIESIHTQLKEQLK